MGKILIAVVLGIIVGGYFVVEHFSPGASAQLAVATKDYVVNLMRTHKELAPLIVLLLTLGESIVGVSLFVPAIFVLPPALAALGVVGVTNFEIAFITAAGAVGGYAGYDGSYWAGRWYGPDIVRIWPIRLAEKHIKAARDYLARHQGWLWPVVAAGHFSWIGRGGLPLLVGMIPMGYAKFASANAVGTVLWALVLIALPLLGGTWASSWLGH